MDRKTAIKIVENEIRCIQSNCDRECGKCELVLPAGDIVTAMTMAVNALERELAAGEDEFPGYVPFS